MSNPNSFNKLQDAIIELLDRVDDNWQPQHVLSAAGPRNPITGSTYIGYYNVPTLMAVCWINGWQHALFATKNQLVKYAADNKLGAKPIKYEEFTNGTTIIYPVFESQKDVDKRVKAIQDAGQVPTEYDRKAHFKFFKTTDVYNIAAQTNIPIDEWVNGAVEYTDGEAADFFDGYSEMVPVGNGKPSYLPQDDVIRMPAIGDFTNGAEYYLTLAHEVVHSTGHASRLARPAVMSFDRFGSHQYGTEEVVAQSGAMAIAAHLGLAIDLENAAKYMKLWKAVVEGQGAFDLLEALRDGFTAARYIIENRKAEAPSN